MELFIVGVIVVGFIAVVIINFRNSDSVSTVQTDTVVTNTDDDSGPGFYLNKLDAMSHGAMFKMGGDDDNGPGFYM